MKILIVPGSARRDSYNAKLAAVAADMARREGVEVDLVGARDLRLPMYDGDAEEEYGMPSEVSALKARFLAADALIFACPEYNSSITPLLKNVIDWVSRAESEQESPATVYQGKVAGLLAASPGALGGLRGLVTVRSILGNLGVIVAPTQATLPKAYEAFDEAGGLNEERSRKSVLAVVKEVIRITKALKP